MQQGSIAADYSILLSAVLQCPYLVYSSSLAEREFNMDVMNQELLDTVEIAAGVYLVREIARKRLGYFARSPLYASCRGIVREPVSRNDSDQSISSDRSAGCSEES